MQCKLQRSIRLGIMMVFFIGLMIFPIINITATNNNSPQTLQDQKSTPIQSSAPPNLPSVDVIDVRNLGFDADQYWVLSSVEGIVNQNSAQLFIIYDSTSYNWITYLNNTACVGNLISVENLQDIINRYYSDFKGMIIFNSSDPAESNIASPLAGIYDSFLVPDSLYTTINGWFPYLSISMNLTATLSAANCSTDLEMYTYASEYYQPLCNATCFAMFGGGSPSNLRGFIIANRLFTTWEPLYVNISGSPPLYEDPPAWQALYEKILASYPVNTVLFGYMYPDGSNEGVVIHMISAANDYLIASDWISNLAFFKNLPLQPGVTLQQNAPQPVPALQNKIYISTIWSDGDNIQYVEGYMRDNLWSDNTRGQVPTGWEINPSLAYLAPYIVKYYYDTKTTNDYFIAGLSGAGYCKFDAYTNQTALAVFLNRSMDLMRACDMNETRGWEITSSANLVTSIYRVNCIFENYGGAFNYAAPRIINGVPIIPAVTFSSLSNDQVMQFIEQLRAAFPSQPLFIYGFLICWSDTQANWTALAQQLKTLPYVSIVRPDTFGSLIREWGGDSFQPVLQAINIVTLIIILGTVGLVILRRRDPISNKPAITMDPTIQGEEEN